MQVTSQSIRIIQAMIDIAADQGWLNTALDVMSIAQMSVAHAHRAWHAAAQS